MLEQLINVVLPVFAVAGVGFLFARFKRADLGTLTDVVLYLAAPALIFSALLSKPMSMERVLAVGGGALFITAVCGAATWLLLSRRPDFERGLYLTTMFPNSGNLGLPLALFAFGEAGLADAVVVFSAISLTHYSLGLFIVARRTSLLEPLKAPILHATALAFACALSGYRPPTALLRGVGLLGEAAVPLMLLSLGMKLTAVKPRGLALPAAAVVLRNVVGLVAAVAWVHHFDMRGTAAGVVVLCGVLPSAVMNFVLADKYAGRSEHVATTILLGTLASVVVIPAVLAWWTAG